MPEELDNKYKPVEAAEASSPEDNPRANAPRHEIYKYKPSYGDQGDHGATLSYIMNAGRKRR